MPVEGQKLGIVEMKKIVVLTAKTVNVVGEVYADGVASPADIGSAFDFVSIMQELSEIRWGLVIPEANDLSVEETNELIEAFGETLNLPSSGVQGDFENLLNVARGLYNHGFNFWANLLKGSSLVKGIALKYQK